MNPMGRDHGPSMDPRHGGRDGSGAGGREVLGPADELGRTGVRLTVAEQRCFEELVRPLWTLRITRGRRSALFGRCWTCLLAGLAGIVGSVVALGVLPLAASFAGFLLALVAFTELSRHATGSTWWPPVRRSLGVVVTFWELLLVAAAFVARPVKRRS